MKLDSKFLLELEDAFRTFIQEGITILLASIGNIVVGPPEDKRILDSRIFLIFKIYFDFKIK